MSTNRLFMIINLLLNQEKITAKELSKKLEVSIRTIYRDVEALSLAGIPIYTTQGTGGGDLSLRSLYFREIFNQ